MRRRERRGGKATEPAVMFAQARSIEARLRNPPSRPLRFPILLTDGRNKNGSPAGLPFSLKLKTQYNTTGLPGEPVAPMIRRGAQMNAPSYTLLSTRDLVSTFSRFQMPCLGCISVWQGTA